MINTERITWFADIILPLAVEKNFTYRIPRDLEDEVSTGARVVVQFGKRKLYTGIVHRIHQDAPKVYSAKYILSVLDPAMISQTQLEFWQWLANYYVCSMGEVMNAALPSAFKLQSETVIIANPDADHNIELDEREKPILEILMDSKEIGISTLMEQCDLKNPFPLIKSLYEKGYLLTREEITETWKPKKIAYIELNEALKNNEEKLESIFNELEKRSPKQLEILMRLVSEHGPSFKVRKTEFLNKNNFTSASAESLAKKGIIEIYYEFEDRFKKIEEQKSLPELSQVQQYALDTMKNMLMDRDAVLLHGVTSSGKTQIYLRLVEEAIQDDGQVLYMVPEIALTAQLIERIQLYFGSRALVFHSRFNENERVEIWKKVSSGEVSVILGARSAIFLPFRKLNMIIIDEEHESSYKQQDPAPRYHARDSALYLASLWKCKTVLGSATPSLESYHNAKEGKYALVEVSERFGKVALPEIKVIDMAEEVRTKKARSIFSSHLVEALEQSLAKGEQAILFHNRKGYIPVTMCVVCGWSPRCVQCDITLTYYKHSNKLVCHYCAYSQSPVSRCGACGNTHLQMLGYGTERIEDDLKLILPTARIARFDTTTTRNKKSHQQIIGEFESGKTDILIGTQMLAKGLDFDRVALVGILHADQLLNYPDFRANERAFQLMEQVAGRAGRRDQAGTVLLQTYKKDHRIIHNLLNHDYAEFFRVELSERKQFSYPPFTRLIRITLKCKDVRILDQATDYTGIQLKRLMGLAVLGPETPLVSKLRNYYLRQFLIKIHPKQQSLAAIKNHIREVEHLLYAEKELRGTYLVADVDPA